MSFTIPRPHRNARIDRMNDVARLRWVLAFTQRDLDGLTSEELEALGDDLRHATSPWWVSKRRCTPMAATQVRALQQEIHDAIQAVQRDVIDFVETVLTSLGHQPLRRGWVRPGEDTCIVRVRLDLHGSQERVWRVGSGTDERTAILEGVATLLVTVGDRLRTCPVCGTLFLRRYRQAYCTVRCSNKVRNRRRLDRQAQRRAMATA